MAAEREPIEINDKPELLRLVEEMEASGQPCILRRNGTDVAVLRPAGEVEADWSFKTTSEDDPLWGIIGIAQRHGDELDPDRPTDVSSNKHKYLADAYADPHLDE